MHCKSLFHEIKKHGRPTSEQTMDNLTLLRLSVRPVPPYDRSNKNCKLRLWLPKLSITLRMNCFSSQWRSSRSTLIMLSAENLSSAIVDQILIRHSVLKDHSMLHVEAGKGSKNRINSLQEITFLQVSSVQRSKL